MREFRDRARPEGGLEGGCHDASFWRRQLRREPAFLGHRLGAR
ncbi:hypothetical protein [Actinomadura mexicana]|nr:hypothetical protein [Actinomadura mexicana]